MEGSSPHAWRLVGGSGPVGILPSACPVKVRRSSDEQRFRPRGTIDNTGGPTAWFPKPSRPRRRAYPVAARSGGLRRLPNDRFGLSVVCSLIAHAMIALLILRVAAPSGSDGTVIPSIATWVDLTVPEPVTGTGHALNRATRTMRSSGPSALPSPTRSASIASAALSSRAEISAESIRPGSAPEALGVDPGSSVVAAAVVPQLPNSLVTLSIIDGRAQDRQAPTAASSLGATLNNPVVADAEPVEIRPDQVSESVAAPQISATAAASSVPGPADEHVTPDREFGRAGPAVSASAAPVKITVDGPRASLAQSGVETVTGKIAGATEYAPLVSSNGIALSSPADGLIITPDEPPVVVVEGRVDDRRTTTLWVVANDRRIPVQVSDGRFRKIVPVVAPTLRVWAEASPAGEPGSRSQIVTVRTAGARRPSAILVMQWPRESQDLDVEVSAVWRAHPDTVDEVAQLVKLTAVSQPSSTGPADVFWLRSVRPGAYSMVLRYGGLPRNEDVHAALYVPEGDGLAVREIRPVRLGSSGKAVLARVLFPHGVLWEQDGWFSGSSESVDTVTKFRFPDGINWVERKADLQ
jgi:hypothetical protein